MTRFLTVAVIGTALTMLLLIIIPSGTEDADVVTGYRSTLSYAESGELPYSYMEALEAGDPLLDAIADTASEFAGYIWEYANKGTPVPLDLTVCTSGFPNYNDGSVHRGTDYDIDVVNPPTLYQVAMWAGKVVYVNKEPETSAWGNNIVIQTSEYFYVRYAHLAVDTEVLGKLEVGDTVAVGQRIGVLGSTGNSSADHLHVELILSPNGTFDNTSYGEYYYGGLEPILRDKKALNEIKWYKIDANKNIGDVTSPDELDLYI